MWLHYTTKGELCQHISEHLFVFLVKKGGFPPFLCLKNKQKTILKQNRSAILGNTPLFLILRKRGKKKKKAFRFTVSVSRNYGEKHSPNCFHFAKTIRNPVLGLREQTLCSLIRVRTRLWLYILRSYLNRHFGTQRLPALFALINDGHSQTSFLHRLFSSFL